MKTRGDDDELDRDATNAEEAAAGLKSLSIRKFRCVSGFFSLFDVFLIFFLLVLTQSTLSGDCASWRASNAT